MDTAKDAEDVLDFTSIGPMYEWITGFVEGVGNRAGDEERKAHATSFTLVRLEKSGAMLTEYQTLLKCALEIMTPEQRRTLLVSLKSSDLPFPLPQHQSRNA